MADPGTYRDRWVAEVYRTHLITDGVRVALLALAGEMDDDGFVSVPRDELAALLARSPRKVSDRLKAAVDAGFLARAGRGQKYRTAAYQATTPRPSVSVTPGGPTENPAQGDGSKHPETTETTSQGDGFKHPEPGLSGTPGGHEESGPLNRNRAHARPKRSPRPQTTHQTDSDHATVIHLFGEEKDQTIAPPAGAATPADEPKPITAQTIVAAYVDGVREAIGEDPTKRLIGQIAKQAKELIQDERRDRDRLVAAARSLGTKITRNFTDLGREYLLLAQHDTRTGAATGTDRAGRAPWSEPNYADEEYFSGF